MRIIFLTHNYPRFAGDISGAFLATLALALTRRGHEIRVVAPSDGGEVGQPALDGIPVRRVRYASAAAETLAYRGTMADAIRSPAGLVALYGLWRALRRATREEWQRGADLIHAHWWAPSGLATPPTLPFVLTSHGTDAALLRHSALARFVAQPVYRRARLVFTVSTAVARWIEEGAGRVIPARHIHPQPVDLTRFPAWSAGGGGLVVVARLSTQKRVHLALEAVAALKGRGRSVALTIIGDGPEGGALGELSRRLGVDNLVHFAGAVPPSELASRLLRADAMIFPAQGEGFGLVAAEAFMCGVPVVACVDGGGVLDVVTGQGGGRLAPPSGEAIATALIDLLDDPGSTAAARRAGAEWRERLTPDHVARIHETWYEEALGRV